MPLDPSISLQGKPVAIDTPDPGKMFLTLSQMKLNNVRAQAAQEEAVRTQQVFGDKQAEGQLLGSLRGGPPAVPATGGPPFDAKTLGALGQGESTPAPTAPQAPTPMDWTSPEGQAQIRRVNPHGADETISKLVEYKGKQLEQQKSALEQARAKIAQVVNLVGATKDQASLDLAHTLLRQQGIDTSTIPTQWTPDLPKFLGESGRTAQQRIEEELKRRELTKQIVLKGIEQDILVPEYPGGTPGPGTPAAPGTPGTAPPGTPGTPAAPGTPGTAPPGTPGGIGTLVPGTEKPLSGEEAKAKANYDLAAASLERLLGHESALASAGPNPTRDLNRIAPSVVEHGLAHNARGVMTATLGALGTGVGAFVGGPWGAGIGGTIGATAGAGVGGVADAAANKLLSQERQAYNGEQLNFIAAVRGEETSRISQDVFDTERDRYFPKPGDTEPEILRKRKVREEAVSAMATRTNRRQGTIPLGQKQATPAATPTGPPTAAYRSPYADKAPHQLTPAQLAEEEAALRKELER